MRRLVFNRESGVSSWRRPAPGELRRSIRAMQGQYKAQGPQGKWPLGAPIEREREREKERGKLASGGLRRMAMEVAQAPPSRTAGPVGVAPSGPVALGFKSAPVCCACCAGSRTSAGSGPSVFLKFTSSSSVSVSPQPAWGAALGPGSPFVPSFQDSRRHLRVSRPARPWDPPTEAPRRPLTAREPSYS